MKRWRLNRADRLRAAPKFVAGYAGKSLVRGYMRWFGVDRTCAVRELIELGVPVPASSLPVNQPPAKRKETVGEALELESDEHFAFIAGCTSGGAPYGTTWEEWESFPPVEHPKVDCSNWL